MQKILIAVDAPGPAEFIEPVLPLLTNWNKQQVIWKIIVVKESPAKILASYNPLRCDTEIEAEKIYKEFNPDILLVATSSLEFGPFVIKKLTEFAHADRKQIICFQDFWGNHRHPQNRDLLKYWQAVIAPDELAQKLLLENGYQNKIIITGNPAFDKFKSIDVPAERKRLRELFQIPEDAFVILYAGTGTPQSWEADEITFKFLAQAVCEFKKSNPETSLIAHAHPRDEKPNRYQELAPDLRLVDSAKAELADNILPIANAVIAMYSTSLIHACYLRIPAVSILLPDAGMRRVAEIKLADFPPNQVGAAIGVYEPEIGKFVRILEKIKTDLYFQSEIRSNQEKYFPFAKIPASQKVFEALMQIIAH